MNKPYAFVLSTLVIPVGLAAFAAPATSFAMQTSPGGSAQSREPVQSDDFVDQASALGTAEVSASKMALEKSSSAAVKTFARQMVKDHTTANQKLATLAGKKGMRDEVSTHPDAKDMALSMKMKMQSGSSFDKSYAARQVTAHEETIALFQREAQTGTDPALKSFAQQTLPKLQAHLKMAQELARKTGAPTD